MRAINQVPENDFSVQGMRVQYKARFRGADVLLWATVTCKRWERPKGCDYYHLVPDRLDEYGNLTHFHCWVSVRDIVFQAESE